MLNRVSRCRRYLTNPQYRPTTNQLKRGNIDQIGVNSLRRKAHASLADDVKAVKEPSEFALVGNLV
jgi:hypothetical protein